MSDATTPDVTTNAAGSATPATSSTTPTSATQPAKAPVVGLVMGSNSDWPTMSAAADVLDEFGIGYEADVVSAHRMAHEMVEYGTRAAERGLRVIIAGAGGGNFQVEVLFHIRIAGINGHLGKKVRLG